MDAQYRFEIKDSSIPYDVKINIDGCNEYKCSGSGKVELYEKGSHHIIQSFILKDLYFDIIKNSLSETSVNHLDIEQSPLLFEDFNFDDSEDLAIRTGDNGRYSLP